MSLASVLKEKSTTAFLKGKIRAPKMVDRPPPRVERRSYPARMGTAVDYAIRFGLEARGGYPPQLHIVADTALRIVTEPAWARFRDAAEERYIKATYDLGDLQATPDLPASVAAACLRLAGLDNIVRARRFDDLEWEPDETAITELQELYALTPWATFRPRDWGVLNPRFGEGSSLLGGADADIVIDSCLIDIKTVSTTKPELKHIRQLAGYALLANRYGIGLAPEGSKIDPLALYFSRAGHLFRFSLDDCIDPNQHDVVLDHLIEVARRQQIYR